MSEIYKRGDSFDDFSEKFLELANKGQLGDVLRIGSIIAIRKVPGGFLWIEKVLDPPSHVCCFIPLQQAVSKTIPGIPIARPLPPLDFGKQ